MWTDERDEIMKLLEDALGEFPRKCPCCGKKNGLLDAVDISLFQQFVNRSIECSRCHSSVAYPVQWNKVEKVAGV